jgi:hypothetical protein
MSRLGLDIMLAQSMGVFGIILVLLYFLIKKMVTSTPPRNSLWTHFVNKPKWLDRYK